ncbi:MAG: phosphopantothenoylcysteine decarboxylase [Steroidobacteraceae bacterium]
MRVLVTSGSTREPIDSVRFISNLSTGRTGAIICESLASRGFSVTQVRGVDSIEAAGVAHREAFTDHASLDALLRRLLTDREYAAVIHVAAVGDYSVTDPFPDGKIPSGTELVLRLKPNSKIIDQIREYAGGRELTLVGFKLTHDPKAEARARAARDLLNRCGADYVVQNDVSTLSAGAGHVFYIHSRGNKPTHKCVGRQQLASALATLLERQQARSAG